jgi:hypothetical protein
MISLQLRLSPELSLQLYIFIFKIYNADADGLLISGNNS